MTGQLRRCTPINIHADFKAAAIAKTNLRDTGAVCPALRPISLETLIFQAGAGDAIRTRDIFLGKEVLYH